MKNVVIYCPEHSSNIFHYHLSQVSGSHIPDTWTFCHNIDVFFSVSGKKIACFQIPYPYDDYIEKELDRILPDVDLVLIIASELHTPTVDFIRKYDHKKIIYFVCGYLHFRMEHAYVDKFLDWFTTTVNFYKYIKPSILFDLRPHDPKPLMFDALLGRKKLHRDIAYEYIQNNGLSDQGLVTYMNTHQMQFGSATDQQWVWGTQGIDNMDQVLQHSWTVEPVEYYGYPVALSQIIPIDIYNQTAYSLVCETNHDNEFTFYTEKTVKPILARRLFIMLGNRWSLAGLRRLGFKTFQGIIDEDYDNIEGQVERHLAAMEQMKWLCSQDQSHILSKVADIVNHNFDRMYSNDWYNLFKQPFGYHFYN